MELNTPSNLPPYSILLGETWSLYKARFGTFLLLVLPLILLQIGNIVFTLPSSGMIVAGVVLFFLASLILQASLFGNIANLNDIGFKASFEYGVKNFLKYFWVSILSSFIIFTGFILLIVPGIIWSLSFAFAPAIIAGEGVSGLQALLRSREYTRDRISRVINYIFLFAITVFLPYFIIITILNLVTGTPLTEIFSKTPTSTPLIESIEIIMSMIITPLSTIFMYTAYKYFRDTRPNIETKKGTGFIVAAVAGVLIVLAIFAAAITLIMNQPKVTQEAQQDSAPKTIFELNL